MRTQIAIIGAGPAGLFLGHLLHKAGIEVTILERKDRAYVEGRVRAGVLEQGTTNLMKQLGVDARLKKEGLVHTSTNLAYDGEIFRINMAELTGGSTVTVYGQQEVMRDLFDAAAERGIKIIFDAGDVTLHEIESDHPFVTYKKDESEERLDCDYIVGCDGYHGVSRGAIPASAYTAFERVYPFGWLGILADVPPVNHELIYANHANGFALASMRSPTRSRYYIQCSVDEKIEDWPDERFWDEVCLRLGPEGSHNLVRGPSFEKTIAPLRSFVGEPMRFGRLFLAGDAAHIVPPTGAKGLNLAVSDVTILGEAFAEFYNLGSPKGLEGYSARALKRVWKAERFSWWFTSIMHRFPNTEAFDRKMQIAELSYLKTSRAAQTALAENYVGLPIE